MAMSRKLHFFTLLLLTQFLYIQVVEAAILRTSGRGSKSSNFSEGYYYVDKQYLNEFGRIKESAFEDQFFSKSILRAVGGGGRGLGSVPNTCINGYTDDDLDDLAHEIAYWDTELSYGRITQEEYDTAVAAENFKIYGEPCVWEFTEGESLSMFGFFSLYFGIPDVVYDVDWSISGQPTLSGEVNTLGDLATIDGTIYDGWVTLNADVDLAPGDYNVFVSVDITTPNGKVFYDRNRPNDKVNLERICDLNPAFDVYQAALSLFEQYQNAVDDYYYYNDPVNYPYPTGPVPPDPGSVAPPDEICGYDSLDSSDNVINAAMSFYSEGEQLRILPANVDPNSPTNDVSAPASMGLLLLGWLGLILRRQTKVKK
jgi:hypothetical protein